VKTLRLRKRNLLLLVGALLSATALSPAAPSRPDDKEVQALVTAADRPVVYVVDRLVGGGVRQQPSTLQVTLYFQVTGTPDRITLRLPVWAPGDYHVQNFSRYVMETTAWNADPQKSEPLPVSHPDASSWEVKPNGATEVAFRYQMREMLPGNFSPNLELRAHMAFWNGPAVYMYLAGEKERPIRLLVESPMGWQVETPLPHPSQDADPPVYNAPDYDTLADSPVVMATPDALVTRAFTQDGATHQVLFMRNPERIPDQDAWVQMIQKVAHTENVLMGSTPYHRYDFFFDVDGEPDAGLEHLNSCRIGLPAALPANRAAAFVGHEFFHLWNVKRIRPAALGPFDYQHPPHTRNLWFAEGVTEYFAQIATRRAGFVSEDDFLGHFRNAIRRYANNPARLRVSAEQSSLRVWETEDSQGYGDLSYYEKGELIGLCLDLTIRNKTDNKKSLTDVMRLLYKRHAPPQPGYGEDELRTVINEVAGVDLSDLYDLLVRSTDEMPFAECLAYAGLDANLQPLPTATPAQIALRKDWEATQ